MALKSNNKQNGLTLRQRYGNDVIADVYHCDYKNELYSENEDKKSLVWIAISPYFILKNLTFCYVNPKLPWFAFFKQKLKFWGLKNRFEKSLCIPKIVPIVKKGSFLAGSYKGLLTLEAIEKEQEIPDLLEVREPPLAAIEYY